MREAIIHLDDGQLAAIGLDDVVEAARAAGLRDVTELVCHGGGGVLLVEVDELIPAVDLDRFDSVAWWERLTGPPSGVTYLCKVTAPDLPDDLALDEHATAHEVAKVGDRGIDLSIVGSQSEISRSVAAVDEAGMNAILRRLTDYRGPASTLDGLTDRQREVIEIAYVLGYYDVPREASSEEVAEAVGVDPSTVSEHLQRAERNLIEGLFEPGT